MVKRCHNCSKEISEAVDKSTAFLFVQTFPGLKFKKEYYHCSFTCLTQTKFAIARLNRIARMAHDPATQAAQLAHLDHSDVNDPDTDK